MGGRATDGYTGGIPVAMWGTLCLVYMLDGNWYVGAIPLALLLGPSLTLGNTFRFISRPRSRRR